MNKMTLEDKAYIRRLIYLTRDRIQVLCKCLVGEKKTLPAIWKIVYSTVGYISAVYAFSELIYNLTGYDVLKECIKEHLTLLVIIGLLFALIHNHNRITFKGAIRGIDIPLMVTIKDMFCVNASSYVIPTNTFFRTILDGEYISTQSVQGAFQLCYCRNKSDILSKDIARSLSMQKIEYEEGKDIYGCVKRYPIGSVAKVDYKSKHFYFVAIADVNEHGKTINQNYKNIEMAMHGLFSAISEIGHCDDLVIPLIGTGRAAISEATIEKEFERTIERFIKIDKKLVRKLTICINPKDYLDGRIDTVSVKKYIDYRCTIRK